MTTDMTETPNDPRDGNLLKQLEAYLTSYVAFTTPDYAFALSLWTAATYLWPHFDAFGYLVITSDTKRSGKTRLSEILQNVSSNPRAFAAMTPSTLFRSIRDENPTIFIDEAEAISGEAAGTMRTVLNVGYRKGQTVPRQGKGGMIEEWPVYCPKVFILIGDMFDTLRDRSIIIRMRRTKAALQRFRYDIAKADGNALGEQVNAFLTDRKDMVLDWYMGASTEDFAFLPDRDAEIWMPLFAVCSVLAPERMDELKRVAVDMTTDKTQESRRYHELGQSEEDATNEEYAERLLKDLHTAMNGDKHLYTNEALDKLKAIPTAPWRKFRGDGLTAIDMGNLLSRFGVAPKLIRTGRKGQKTGTNAERVARGYRAEDVTKAIAGL